MAESFLDRFAKIHRLPTAKRALTWARRNEPSPERKRYQQPPQPKVLTVSDTKYILAHGKKAWRELCYNQTRILDWLESQGNKVEYD